MEAGKLISKLWHMVVDEHHPMFEAYTDENVEAEGDGWVKYSRVFAHDSGDYYLMRWTEYDNAKELDAAIVVNSDGSGARLAA